MPSAATKMPNLSGSTIDGRYKLIQILGSGNFGVVYKALDIHASVNSPDRFRAIKIVSKAGRKPYQLDSVRREIDMHTRVSFHPNVVTLHNAYEDELYFIFIMDYCGGGDLDHYLNEHGPFTSEAKLKTMFLAILSAVEALHAKGIYHRDLKPANILLSEDGSQVYLADFGLANTIKSSYSRCGTPAYMSPELIDATTKRLCFWAACDVWALGIILLNMLSGRIPWKQATLAKKTYAGFVANPRYLLELLPISLGLNKVIRRMLRANAFIRIRLPNARQAFAELDTLFRDCDVPLPEPSTTSDTNNHHVRSTMQSEIDMEACWAHNAAAQQGLHCSAGSGASSRTKTNTTGSKRNSSGSDSSGQSSAIATPGDSVALKGVDEKSHDHAVGERVKAIVSRLKAKFSSRSSTLPPL